MSPERTRHAGVAWLSALVACAIAACTATDTTSTNAGNGGPSPLATGGSQLVPTGTTVSVPGGTKGGEFVLVVTDTAVDGTSAATSYQIAGTGLSAGGTVSSPSTSRSPLGIATRGSALDFGFASRMNVGAQRALAPRVAAARQSWAPRTAASRGISRALSSAAPQVGDVITLNVSDTPCDSIQLRGSRIVAIGAQAIVVADTMNPTGGFTQSDYQRFAARFDTLVYPVDVSNFGAPAPFGPEGKILLLFTSAVNALTMAKSESYVGGFFFSRDLYPDATTMGGCAGSNMRNMFYLLAPDPTGTVNGNIRRTGFVDSVTTSVLAHEFQHLINASRRLYVNQGAKPFEEIWLNEGLSHVAEELLFYHEGESLPKNNLGATSIRASAKLVSAFNADEASNAGRYQDYLTEPAKSSPIRNDDSLSTRGATWDFLRYLADRKTAGGGTDASVWQSLVNSKTSGIANLRQVFGTNIGSMLRDWSVSQYADDVVAGVSTDFLQPSWNWHSLYPALSGSAPYPLKIIQLSSAPASGSVIPGGAAFYRFSVAGNATATVTLTNSSGTTASPLQGVVVRLR
jgi:hypothetical protein